MDAASQECGHQTARVASRRPLPLLTACEAQHRQASPDGSSPIAGRETPVCPSIDPRSHEAPIALLDILQHSLFHIRRSQGVSVYLKGVEATFRSSNSQVLRQEGSPDLQPGGKYATYFVTGEPGSAILTMQAPAEGASTTTWYSLTVTVDC